MTLNHMHHDIQNDSEILSSSGIMESFYTQQYLCFDTDPLRDVTNIRL
jgi:hypothetical protein